MAEQLLAELHVKPPGGVQKGRHVTTGPARNFCVARGNVAANTSVPVFTVPAGHSFIFKGLALNATNPTVSAINVYLVASTGNPSVGVLNEAPSQSGVFNIQWWHVLNAGDMIQIWAVESPCTYWISGALLPYNGAQPPVVQTVGTATGPPQPHPPGPPPQYVRILT